MNIEESNNLKLNLLIELLQDKNPHILEFIEQFRDLQQKIIIEYSVKISNNSIIYDRIIIGILHSIDNPFALDKVISIVKKYNFPENCLNLLVEKYPKIQLNDYSIGIGIENLSNRYKIYFENKDIDKPKVFSIKWTEQDFFVQKYLRDFRDLYKQKALYNEQDLIPKFITIENYKSKIAEVLDTDTTATYLKVKDLYMKDLTEDITSLISSEKYNSIEYLQSYPLAWVSFGLYKNEKYLGLIFHFT
jgi:hypothetical protein